MKRVLYGVSPIGLGHATRASAVGAELKRSDVEVVFASGGRAADYLRGEGFDVREVVHEPTPKVVGGEMKGAAMWYLRYWRGYRRTRGAMEKLIGNFAPDLIVGDEEFAGVTLALERGMRHALVTDEFELGFARTAAARTIETQASRWFRRLLESAAAVVVPDFGEDSGNRRHVGPIVRKVTRTREQVFREYSLPAGGKMVLFSMSGSGLGEHLLSRTVSAVRELGTGAAFLVVAGNRGGQVRGEGIFDLGVVRENQDLVAAADLVVSTAGKSTIDEAASAGTPIIALPIKNHAEQERNAAALGYRPADVDRLLPLMRERLGKRQTPAQYRGAENASSLFASMLS